MKYSISRRFTFALTGVITFIMVLFSILIIMNNNSGLEKQLNRNMANTADMAVKALANAVWAMDFDSITAIVKAISADESVVFIKVILEESSNTITNVRPDFENYKDFSFFENSPRFISGQSEIKKGIEKVGIFQIAMTRDIIRNQLLINIVSIISMMIFLIAAVLITCLAITRRYIFSPLSKLAESARLIAQGNSDIPITSFRDDEIGSLANDFDMMRKSVRDVNKTVEDYIWMLEKRTAQLVESEKKFRAIYESSDDAIMLLEEKGFSDCNPRTLKMFGFKSKDEFIGLQPSDLSPPFQADGQDSFSMAQARIRTAFKEGHHFFEWTHRRENGEIFPAEVLLSAFDLGGQTVLQATIRDITERKQAELSLKESEIRYRSLFDGVPVGLYRSTPDGKVLDVNLTMVMKIGGYPSREAYMAVSPAKRYANHEDRLRFKTLMELEGFVHDFEFQFRRFDDTVIWVKNTARSVMDGYGKVLYYEGIMEDITEHKQAESLRQAYQEKIEQEVRERTHELSETLEHLRKTQSQLIQTEKIAALGQLIAGIAHEINTPLGAIRASVGNISDALKEMPEQFPKLFRLLSEEQQQNFFALIQRSLENRTVLSAKEERKLKRTLTKILEEHKTDQADSVADTLTDMGVYDNIDMFLPLLLHAESDFVLKTAYNLSGLQKSTRNISVAAERASKVVFALKSYARFDSSGHKVRADLTEGIETVLTLYNNKLKHGVEVLRHYEELTPFLCYPDELCQVWTNLIHNAIQAMENKGLLEIGVCRQDNNAVVTFTDSGKGIPIEAADRIFEPFFTTKPLGEGSGLGLSIVKKIIDKHDGKIKAESRPGRTSFSVILPICHKTE